MFALRPFHISRKPTLAQSNGNKRVRRSKRCARTTPTSGLTPRTLVAVAQIAEDAKNQTDADYFLRAAVNSFPSAGEVAQAQFDLAWEAHEAKELHRVVATVDRTSRALR